MYSIIDILPFIQFTILNIGAKNFEKFPVIQYREISDQETPFDVYFLYMSDFYFYSQRVA